MRCPVTGVESTASPEHFIGENACECDVEMMAGLKAWPNTVILPVKRREDSGVKVGVIGFDSMPKEATLRIYQIGMFSLTKEAAELMFAASLEPDLRSKLEHLGFEEYPDARAAVDAGWVVD